MKTLIIIVFCMMSTLYAQTAILPQGAGTAESPYLIENLGNLYWITQDSTRWDDHYVQTSDIDASETQNWFGGLGWLPIASTGDFIGTYDGVNFDISDLTIRRNTYNIYHGLFRSLNNATVKNIRLNRVNYQDCFLSGGIAGKAIFSQIINCHVNGNITGSQISGIVQEINFSTILKCSFNGLLVNRYINSGGLVGKSTDSNISESFVYAHIIGGHENTGGLLGRSSRSYIRNCYSRGDYFGPNYTGGLIGTSYLDSLYYCYTNSVVKGQDAINPIIGGLSNINSPSSVIACFWNTDTSGIDQSSVGIGLNNEEMRNIQNYLTQNWDFVNEAGDEDFWKMEGDQNNGFPFLNHLNYMKLPNISVEKATEIGINSANITTNLSFTYNNGALSQGICYSTEASPNVSNSEIMVFANHSNTGNTTVSLRQLNTNTLYFIRGFVITNTDTLYSGDMIFNTLPIETQIPQGTGTAEDPFQIDNKHHLLWLSLNSDYWTNDFIQTSNIDLIGSDQWFPDIFGVNRGFRPIGNILVPFMGNYDGQGYLIDHLNINQRPLYYAGLFGLVGNDRLDFDLKNIKNIVIDHANITGSKYSGILAGRIYCYKIESCSVKGTVNGESVSAGFIGRARNSEILCSSSIATITGNAGFCGEINETLIRNCYTRGTLTATSMQNAGFTCRSSYGGNNNNCYSAMEINNPYNYQIYPFSYICEETNCFFDSTLFALNTNRFATGLSTEEMKNINNYLEADWDFETIWAINENYNEGYPYLQWQNIPTSTGETTIEPNISRIQTIYPNPFNPRCSIAFEIGKASPVQIEVFNIKGQKVNQIFSGTLNAGAHTIVWNGKDDQQRSCSSGIYFVRMQNQGQQSYRKIMMIK